MHQCAAAEAEIHLFKPSKYLTFSVHMDGQREHHDFSVCLEGGYDKAVEGMKEALAGGFRVTTNTTLFDGADPKSVRAFFDEMMDLGVEGMMLSPAYSYEKAPDQSTFWGGLAPGDCSAACFPIANRSGASTCRRCFSNS